MALSVEVSACLAQVGDKITDKSAAVSSLEKLNDFARSASAAPFLVKGLPALLTTASNKEKTVAAAAAATVEAIINNLNKYAVRHVMPVLLASLGNKKKPEEKLCALRMLGSLAIAHPQEVSWCLADALPPALELMTDIKKDVQAAALDACTKLSSVSGNKDVEPFVPEMMSAIMKPTTIGDVVEKLASVIFVQAVETPALAVAIPVVFRGLKDKKEPTKRKACVIIDNMVKLVPDPREVLPFLGMLLPALKKACDEISDPEARGVAERAYNTLLRAQESTEPRSADPEVVKAAIKDPVGEECRYDDIGDIVDYLTGVCCGLTAYRNFDKAVWTGVFSDFKVPADVAENTCDLE